MRSEEKIITQGTHFKIVECKSRVDKTLTIYRLFEKASWNSETWALVTQSRYLERIQTEIDSKITM